MTIYYKAAFIRNYFSTLILMYFESKLSTTKIILNISWILAYTFLLYLLSPYSKPKPLGLIEVQDMKYIYIYTLKNICGYMALFSWVIKKIDKELGLLFLNLGTGMSFSFFIIYLTVHLLGYSNYLEIDILSKYQEYKTSELTKIGLFTVPFLIFLIEQLSSPFYTFSYVEELNFVFISSLVFFIYLLPSLFDIPSLKLFSLHPGLTYLIQIFIAFIVCKLSNLGISLVQCICRKTNTVP